MVCCGHIVYLMVVLVYRLVLLLWLVLILVLLFVLLDGVIVVRLKLWVSYFLIDLEFILDIWGVMFALLVILIRLFVIFFSYSYINGLVLLYFMIYYFLFIFCIIFLVFSNNFY